MALWQSACLTRDGLGLIPSTGDEESYAQTFFPTVEGNKKCNSCSQRILHWTALPLISYELGLNSEPVFFIYKIRNNYHTAKESPKKSVAKEMSIK